MTSERRWIDEMLKDPAVRRAYERAKRRRDRLDRLLWLRHLILPFMHDWRGPYGEDGTETRCRVCGRPGPEFGA